MTPQDRLTELAWLEGGWREEVGETVATTEWKWSEDGNFLISADFRRRLIDDTFIEVMKTRIPACDSPAMGF